MSQAPVTVLVVEDDDLFREMTVKLVQRPGRTVLAAADPAAALKLARRHGKRIDLLVTDLVMDEGDGLALAHALAVKHPALKTLFMSGYGESALRAGIEETADRTFIEKPFTPDALESAVERLLAAT